MTTPILIQTGVFAPTQPHYTKAAKSADGPRRARLLKAMPWLWLALSAAWAVVIFTTDQLAWPLALWVATTLGPLTALDRRFNPKTDLQKTNPEGSNQ